MLAQRRVADLERPFLAKPFAEEELLAKVEAVLQQLPPAEDAESAL